jgi:hypothetical protein
MGKLPSPRRTPPWTMYLYLVPGLKLVRRAWNKCSTRPVMGLVLIATLAWASPITSHRQREPGAAIHSTRAPVAPARFTYGPAMRPAEPAAASVMGQTSILLT